MPASGAEGSLLPRPHPQIRISGAGGASRPLRACTTCRLADSSLNEVVDANSVAADCNQMRDVLEGIHDELIASGRLVSNPRLTARAIGSVLNERLSS